MLAAVEISLYPLSGDYLPIIRSFIDRLNTHTQLQVQTNSLSTQIWGELDEIMVVLTAEIATAARDAPQLVFVMKVLPGVTSRPAAAGAPS